MTDKPDENESDDVQSLVNNILGDESAAHEFFSALEIDPMKEAWTGFHSMYVGLLAGGFTPLAAQGVMGVYLYTMLSGGETN